MILGSKCKRFFRLVVQAQGGLESSDHCQSFNVGSRCLFIIIENGSLLLPFWETSPISKLE